MKSFDMSILYLNTEDNEKFIREDSARIQKLVQKLGLHKQ
jgi:hypothetical protein